MKFLISYIWVILWTIIVCVVLLLPAQNFGGIPIFAGIDKMFHMGIFYGQATLLYLGIILYSDRKANKWLSILKVMIACSIFAVATEYAQMYLTNSRSADPWDIFADVVGVSMATFTFVLIYKREKR